MYSRFKNWLNNDRYQRYIWWPTFIIVIISAWAMDHFKAEQVFIGSVAGLATLVMIVSNFILKYEDDTDTKKGN